MSSKGTKADLSLEIGALTHMPCEQCKHNPFPSGVSPFVLFKRQALQIR